MFRLTVKSIGYTCVLESEGLINGQQIIIEITPKSNTITHMKAPYEKLPRGWHSLIDWKIWRPRLVELHKILIMGTARQGSIVTWEKKWVLSALVTQPTSPTPQTIEEDDGLNVQPM